MSSNHAAAAAAAPSATIAATPKTSSKKKLPPPISGFHAIASRLLDLFHSSSRKSTIKSVSGATNLAYKSLRTSFTGSLNGAKRKDVPSTPLPSSAAAISPSNKKRRTNQSSTTRRSFVPSPIKFPTNYDDDSYVSDDSPGDDIFSLPRHDELFLPISSSSKGVRRLTIEEILRLNTRDEFIIFLPPYNRNDHKA